MKYRVISQLFHSSSEFLFCLKKRTEKADSSWKNAIGQNRKNALAPKLPSVGHFL